MQFFSQEFDKIYPPLLLFYKGGVSYEALQTMNYGDIRNLTQFAQEHVAQQKREADKLKSQNKRR